MHYKKLARKLFAIVSPLGSLRRQPHSNAQTIESNSANRQTLPPPIIAKKKVRSQNKRKGENTFLDRFCGLTVRLLSGCTLGLHFLERDHLELRCFTTTFCKRNVKNKRSTWESFVQFFLGLSGKPKEVLRTSFKTFYSFLTNLSPLRIDIFVIFV